MFSPREAEKKEKKEDEKCEEEEKEEKTAFSYQEKREIKRLYLGCNFVGCC